MPEAVIVAAARTPIGRARKGSLADVRPDDLAAFVIDDVLDKVPTCRRRGRRRDGRLRLPGGEAGHEPRPRASRCSPASPTVPGTTVNRFCASSLQTIRMAFHAIRAGEGDVFVAAGVESISQVSGYPKRPRSCTRGSFGDDARRSRTSTSRWA